MNTKDEELQNQIEKQNVISDELDAMIYSKVFNALKQEPDFRLSTNFADQVILKIENKKEFFADYMWFGVGIFLFVVATIVAILLTNFTLNFGVLKFMAGYKGLFIFGVCFILALHWFDKKLIKTPSY